MSKLREFRQAKGLTQTKLARKIKMANSCVSAVETGNRQPWPNFQKRVSKALGVPESEIFCDE
ncbi:MAG: helix-turn-helix transcriptional regulator [Actinomycetota bacterium]|nr:helix-turn-helix transcriptional regulator [Actinomycetota bacterium]